MAFRMNKRTGSLIGAAALVAISGAGVAVATSGGDDAPDEAITGAALEQAEEAALAETGGGEVTETEVGDEESLYEVEVTLDDGTQVDVQLDENFDVVGSETEDGAEEDDES